MRKLIIFISKAAATVNNLKVDPIHKPFGSSIETCSLFYFIRKIWIVVSKDTIANISPVCTSIMTGSADSCKFSDSFLTLHEVLPDSSIERQLQGRCPCSDNYRKIFRHQQPLYHLTSPRMCAPNLPWG